MHILICWIWVTGCHRSLHQDGGVEGSDCSCTTKKKKIYFNKKATKGAQLAFMDTTAWVMLSKMLFITVHLVVVHRVHVIFNWQRFIILTMFCPLLLDSFDTKGSLVNNFNHTRKQMLIFLWFKPCRSHTCFLSQVCVAVSPAHTQDDAETQWLYV